MEDRRIMLKKALCAAFPHTIPIFAGFWFLGLTYGIYMHVSGFSFWYPMLISVIVFAGSIEFVAVNMLLGAFDPLQALAITLMVNARHLFYGISMLDRFRGLGLKKIYLIFGMCDETFSINYTTRIPDGVDRGWFMFFVTLLNHFYWFSGATLGGLFGSDRSEFCHARHVHRDLHGAMAQGRPAHGSACGHWGLRALSADFRSKSFHHSVHDRHSRHPDRLENVIWRRTHAVMTLSQQIFTIAMVVSGTALTRFLPFLLFSAGKSTPLYIRYLGRVLPSAVFGLLVVYSLKDTSVLTGNHGLPELLAGALVVVLHIWKRQMLVSIAGGTIAYMLLVQFVF